MTAVVLVWSGGQLTCSYVIKIRLAIPIKTDSTKGIRLYSHHFGLHLLKLTFIFTFGLNSIKKYLFSEKESIAHHLLFASLVIYVDYYLCSLFQ